MILVNNSPHDNGVYTFIDTDTGRIIKSSYSIQGIGRIKREFEGYQWYLKRAGLKEEAEFNFAPQSSDYYTRAYIKCFPGIVGDSNRRLGLNRALFLKVIEHYVEIWPTNKNELAPLHGDFSIGNMIFHKETTTIIDWEHFALNIAPWGFDLVNMLYESVYLTLNGKRELCAGDLKAFNELRNIIIALLPSDVAFTCTLEHVSDFINNNALLWEGLIKKFPVLKFTNEQKEYLRTIEY